MKALRYIELLGAILMGGLLCACDVHEFPYPVNREVTFVLHLTYDTELPLYKTLTYDNESRAGETEDFDIRYTINVYNADEEANEREIVRSFVFTKDEVASYDNSVELTLEPGNYTFRVWSDFIEAGGGDLHYSTSNFAQIRIQGEEHPGSNDLRDAFRGVITSEVSKEVTEATVVMQRPMAKYNFISVDMQDFIISVQEARANKLQTMGITDAETKAVSIDDFEVVMRYGGFMPTEFNMFTDKPSDSEGGVSYKSKMRMLDNGEVELGFDYVFTNGTESSVNVSIEVYDYDGELLSTFRSVNVPLKRSHLTTIRAQLLTAGTGGVTVVPEFDGEYNYLVD